MEIKRGLWMCILCIFALVCLSSSVFASNVIFNSTFSSGESLTVGGKTYELFINPGNNDLLLLDQQNNAVVLSYFQDVIIDNYIFTHDGTQKVGSDVINDTGFGDTSNLITRVRLIVSTYEPKILYDWTVSRESILVGEEIEFIFTVNNTDEAIAKNVTFVYELPEYFVIDRVRFCSEENNVITFTTDLGEGDEFECIFRGTVYQSQATEENLSGILSFQTKFQNLTEYPSISMPSVSDPFSIVVDVDETLNRTQEFFFNLTIDTNVSDKVFFSNMQIHFPSQFVSVTNTPFIKKVLPELPFQTATTYTTYTKQSTSLSGSSEPREYGFRLTADNYGYVPVVIHFNYEYDDEDYIYGPKKFFLNITPSATSSSLNLSPEPSMNYSLHLSNISVSSLDTFATKRENIHFKLGNECTCVLENISVDLDFLNETLFSHLFPTMASGEIKFVSSLGHYIPFSLSDESYPLNGILSYYFEGVRYEENLSFSISAEAGEEVEFEKDLSDSEVEVDQGFNVTVSATSGFYAPNMTFVVFENQSYLEEHFRVIGPTKRNLTLVSDVELLVYQYELIPRQVDNETEFFLETSYSSDYGNLLFFNQTIFNESFDGKNQTHVDWLSNRYAANSSFFVKGNLSETITVVPKSSGVTFEAELPDEVVLGELFSINVTISNNGTEEISDVRLYPRLSKGFQVVAGNDFQLTQLIPGEDRTATFFYRLITSNSSILENETALSVSYKTKREIRIVESAPLEDISFDEVEIIPVSDLLVPHIAITKDYVSNKTRYEVTASGFGNYSLSFLFLNGTEHTVKLSAGSTFFLNDSLNPQVLGTYHDFDTRQLEVPFTTYAIYPEELNESEDNSTSLDGVLVEGLNEGGDSEQSSISLISENPAELFLTYGSQIIVGFVVTILFTFLAFFLFHNRITGKKLFPSFKDMKNNGQQKKKKNDEPSQIVSATPHSAPVSALNNNSEQSKSDSNVPKVPKLPDALSSQSSARNPSQLNVPEKNQDLSSNKKTLGSLKERLAQQRAELNSLKDLKK